MKKMNFIKYTYYFYDIFKIGCCLYIKEYSFIKKNFIFFNFRLILCLLNLTALVKLV